MRSNAIGVLVCCLVVVALCTPQYVLANQGLSNGKVVTPGTPANMQPNGVAGCNLITFEGLGDNQVIGVVPGPVTVTFGGSWLGLIDADNGGSGNFANEPSPYTIAYFLDTNDISISLSPSVQYLEFFYTAHPNSLPITVTAYDSGNNVVDSEVGNVVGFDPNCTGDPNGGYCAWGVITLTAASDNIAYITITGTVANAFGIDNLQFCTEEVETAACCLPDGTCATLSAENCRAAGGTWYQGRSCEGADCETVPTKSSTWGGIKALYRTP
jgi:hypothetical protein